MEVGIFKNGEKITVVIESNFTVTTYNFFDVTLLEVAQFIKILTSDDEGK